MRWGSLLMAIRRLIGTVSLLLAVLCGCRSWNTPEGESAPAPDAAWSANLREPTRPGHQLGIDQRAREIEENLGVR
jgi:hypothetical protein